MRVLVLALFLIATSNAIARDARALAGDGRIERKQFLFHLTPDDISKIAPWRIEARSSAVSPDDAMKIARRQLSQLAPRRIQWDFQHVYLKEVARGRWVYVVRFFREYPPTIAVYGADYFEIPVSMRGATFRPNIKRF